MEVFVCNNLGLLFLGFPQAKAVWDLVMGRFERKLSSWIISFQRWEIGAQSSLRASFEVDDLLCMSVFFTPSMMKERLEMW